MKKKVLRVVALVAVCAALVLGWRWYADGRFLETTDDAYVEGDITSMTPKVAGHVVEVPVADNQRVKAGDVLLRIDDRDYRAALAEAKAVLVARHAALAQLDDKVGVQQAVFQQAGAGINAAKAQATLQGNSAQATAAKRQMAVLEADREVAAAQVIQAQAQLEIAQANLEATVIRAPVDGIIGNRVARPGAYVRPGQHLLSVVPIDSVWVDANFKETQLTHMRPGQKATLKIDAFPDSVLTGTLDSLSPATGAKFSLLPPENATGNFTKIVQRVPVRIRVPADNPLAGRLAPGLSVIVTIDTRGGEPR